MKRRLKLFALLAISAAAASPQISTFPPQSAAETITSTSLPTCVIAAPLGTAPNGATCTVGAGGNDYGFTLNLHSGTDAAGTGNAATVTMGGKAAPNAVQFGCVPYNNLSGNPAAFGGWVNYGTTGLTQGNVVGVTAFTPSQNYLYSCNFRKN